MQCAFKGSRVGQVPSLESQWHSVVSFKRVLYKDNGMERDILERHRQWSKAHFDNDKDWSKGMCLIFKFALFTARLLASDKCISIPTSSHPRMRSLKILYWPMYHWYNFTILQNSNYNSHYISQRAVITENHIAVFILYHQCSTTGLYRRTIIYRKVSLTDYYLTMQWRSFNRFTIGKILTPSHRQAGYDLCWTGISYLQQDAQEA